MMVEGTFLGLGLLAWFFFEAAREGIEKQRLLDLAHDRGVELDAAARPARGRRRATARGWRRRSSAPRRRPSRDGAGSPVSPLDRARAWLVTGPLGRGLSFAIDFGAALRTCSPARRD